MRSAISQPHPPRRHPRRPKASTRPLPLDSHVDLFYDLFKPITSQKY